MSVTEPERPYAGRYAELYDLFYADKPYGDEAAFVHQCIREFSGILAHDILELACGTGRHAFELEKFGYAVTATDRSVEMLGVARQRAAENDSRVEFVAADMQQLDLPKKNWDAAVCLFDSIGYLKTNAAIKMALDRIRDHLRQAGLFVFEFWHAPAMLNGYSPIRKRSWKMGNAEIVRTSETSLDHDNSLANVRYTVNEIRNGQTFNAFRELHINRFFTVDEMEKLLTSARFEPLKCFAGFNKTEPIGDKTWHIVAVARKS